MERAVRAQRAAVRELQRLSTDELQRALDRLDDGTNNESMLLGDVELNGDVLNMDADAGDMAWDIIEKWRDRDARKEENPEAGDGAQPLAEQGEGEGQGEEGGFGGEAKAKAEKKPGKKPDEKPEKAEPKKKKQNWNPEDYPKPPPWRTPAKKPENTPDKKPENTPDKKPAKRTRAAPIPKAKRGWKQSDSEEKKTPSTRAVGAEESREKVKEQSEEKTTREEESRENEKAFDPALYTKYFQYFFKDDADGGFAGTSRCRKCGAVLDTLSKCAAHAEQCGAPP